MEKFYTRVSGATKRLLDSKAGSNMMKTKTDAECLEMIEDLATSTYIQPGSGGITAASKSIRSVESSIALAAQV